jgi:hypothetical protein
VTAQASTVSAEVLLHRVEVGAPLCRFEQCGVIGVDGVRALFAVGTACRRAGVEWALVASHPVRRLLASATATASYLPSIRSARRCGGSKSARTRVGCSGCKTVRRGPSPPPPLHVHRALTAPCSQPSTPGCVACAPGDRVRAGPLRPRGGCLHRWRHDGRRRQHGARQRLRRCVPRLRLHRGLRLRDHAPLQPTNMPAGCGLVPGLDSGRHGRGRHGRPAGRRPVPRIGGEVRRPWLRHVRRQTVRQSWRFPSPHLLTTNLPALSGHVSRDRKNRAVPGLFARRYPARNPRRCGGCRRPRQAAADWSRSQDLPGLRGRVKMRGQERRWVRVEVEQQPDAVAGASV